MYRGECIVIGISDSRRQWLAPDVEAIVRGGRLFSGGRRHHEIMAPFLPDGHEWIDITVPIADVFRRYEAALCDMGESGRIIVFASGDPLFYGFAATVQREWPDCRLRVFPAFNSLQLLAHRLCLPYHDMRVVSLTGRPWDKLDEALIRQEPLIGCLTDRNKTPQAIRSRMLEYGYDNYEMIVGELLGNEEQERVGLYEEAREYAVPNCLILRRAFLRPRPFGIPEQDFYLLDGRERMITKMPIRLLALAMLGLHDRRSLWDVGFCTGSVSIEARLQFPHLAVTAFEVREEGRRLMTLNSRRFGTPGIATVIGDFMETDLTAFSRPDAVFIGGHGGRLADMLCRISPLLLPDACIVFNSVSEQSRQLFIDSLDPAGLSLAAETRIAIDEHNPIHILKAIPK